MVADLIDFDDLPPGGKQREPRLVRVGAGRLGLWAKPTPARLDRWKAKGLTTLVTLLSEREGALRMAEHSQAAGLAWLWFAQENGQNLPAQRQRELLMFLAQVSLGLDQGNWVVIHCAAGQHRTGMAAYALLRQRGLSPDLALEQINLMRPVTREGVGDKRLAWVERWLRL